MSKNYSQLTEDERIEIYTMKQAGNSLHDIAKALDRHVSTISRELKRNSGLKGYRPRQAQIKARQRHSSGQPVKLTGTTLKYIKQKLRLDWAPEQIAETMKIDPDFIGQTVCIETIYRLVWEDKKTGGTLHRHLRLAANRKKRKRSSSKDNRGKINNRRDIDTRPAVVDQRTRLGDWEADLVAGKGHQGFLVTLVERVSRQTIIGHVRHKTAEMVTQEIIHLLKPYQPCVHTITFDNGKEFAGHETIAQQLQCDCFFAKPYHSWERGLNENTNGLIRQYFPKKMSLRRVSYDKIQVVMDRLNHRPRKCLEFKTPQQVFIKLKLKAA